MKTACCLLISDNAHIIINVRICVSLKILSVATSHTKKYKKRNVSSMGQWYPRISRKGKKEMGNGNRRAKIRVEKALDYNLTNERNGQWSIVANI